MRNLLFIVICLFILSGSGFSQTTWYVDDDAPNDPGPNDPSISDPNEDGSQNHPFDEIMEGINAAFNGDTVLVLEGTYYEGINFNGKAITVTGTYPDDWMDENGVVAATIIDGNNSFRPVVFNTGEGLDSILQGFTIFNGRTGSKGAGIYCVSSPTVQKNRIIGNYCSSAAHSYGAGIYCSSSIRILNNIVKGNTAYATNSSWPYKYKYSSYGGGIYCSSSAIIQGNIISGNKADSTMSYGHGGGIFDGSSTKLAKITNNTIKDNDAKHYGGGIYYAAPGVLENNIVTDGNEASNGGGIYLASTGIVRNNIISKNTASTGGGAYTASDGTFENNTISENTAKSGGGIYATKGMVEKNIITNNIVTKDGDTYGGGMFLNGSVTVQDNYIAKNKAETTTDFNNTFGGGIYCTGSTTIRNNTIEQNSAVKSLNGNASGGGIYFAKNDASIFDGNFIHANSANQGGGVQCSLCSPSITNNTFKKNTALTDGGGLFIENCTLAICSSNILENTASNYMGGGIYLYNASDVTVYNSILRDNNAMVGKNALIDSTSTLTIGYSNVKGGNSMQSIYPENGGTLNWLTGNIDADPEFIDYANNDFHIYFSSPCRDAGDNSAPGLPAEDVDGNPRIDNWNGCKTTDIGADEFYRHFYITGDMTINGTVEFKLIGWPGTPCGIYVGIGVFPNPLPTPFGDWYLMFPVSFYELGPIPTDGLIKISFIIPTTPPAPYSIPMQGIFYNQPTKKIYWLSDLVLLDVK